MQIAILPLSSSTEVTELALAIQRAELEIFDFSWKDSTEKLLAADGYILPSDAHYSLTTSYSQALLAVLSTQNKRGKPILGIGYGASFLVETGLIPGLFNERSGLSLVENITPGEL